MAHAQRQIEFVRQRLEGPLPQARPRSIAAAAIRGDQEAARAREAVPAHPPPPLTNAVDGERRRVMVDADADPALIVPQIIHAVGDRFAERLVEEVVDPHVDRFSAGGHSRPPFLKSPTNSFFFVSTEIVGWPRR